MPLCWWPQGGSPDTSHSAPYLPSRPCVLLFPWSTFFVRPILVGWDHDTLYYLLTILSADWSAHRERQFRRRHRRHPRNAASSVTHRPCAGEPCRGVLPSLCRATTRDLGHWPVRLAQPHWIVPTRKVRTSDLHGIGRFNAGDEQPNGVERVRSVSAPVDGFVEENNAGPWTADPNRRPPGNAKVRVDPLD